MDVAILWCSVAVESCGVGAAVRARDYLKYGFGSFCGSFAKIVNWRFKARCFLRVPGTDWRVLTSWYSTIVGY